MQQAKQLKQQLKEKKAKGKLFGVPVSVKDNICVQGIESTAGSKILKGYLPTFDATAVARAQREGAIIVGKTAQDEFGFGVFSVNVGVGFSIPKNPLDVERSCGGSSGGAGGFAQLTKFSHAAISESTGGSIASPAAFTGTFGFTPTYGRVSRYGLIDYASSLDKIGSISKSVQDSALLMSAIAGHDARDSTSAEKPLEDYSKKKFSLGVVKEFFHGGLESGVEKKFHDSLKKLEKSGFSLKEISLPLNAKYGIPSYYLIAMSEASTNLAKFCGMRYGYHENLEGNFNEYFSKVRSSALGKEAKRRIMLGTFARMAGYRDAYYLKALKARTLIIQEYQQAFKKADVIVSPTMPFIAPKFSDIEKMPPLQHYLADLFTVGPNLAGMPHASIPCALEKGMPLGLMLTSDHFEESKLFQASAKAQEVLGFG